MHGCVALISLYPPLWTTASVGTRQNFGTVEEDLYRSGHPNELNFPFLERLGLKTIVYLSAEEPSEALYVVPLATRRRRRAADMHSDQVPRTLASPRSMNFVDDQGIRWCHLGTDSQHNAWDPMSEDVVVQALGIILDTDNYPLMIMCNLGRHRTGALPHALRCL